MVRVSSNRGTSTRNVKSGRSKSKRAKPSMRSGRGTISRSSSGSYGKSEEQPQVQDLVGELLAEVAEKNLNLVQQV